MEINRFRPKLGHDLREIHTNTTRDHELKDAGLAHRLERRQRDGHLRFMIAVLVEVGLVLVELLRERLVRVRLDGQRFPGTEYLQQPR